MNFEDFENFVNAIIVALRRLPALRILHSEESVPAIINMYFGDPLYRFAFRIFPDEYLGEPAYKIEMVAGYHRATNIFLTRDNNQICLYLRLSELLRMASHTERKQGNIIASYVLGGLSEDLIRLLRSDDSKSRNVGMEDV
jgi:hypothetical protein